MYDFSANPKFQQTAPTPVSGYVAHNLEEGKRFEREFAIAVRKAGLPLARLMDNRYNKPDCDHFTVFSPQHGRPGIILFDEDKSTGCQELPLQDIKPHQLAAMCKYDHAFPGLYAGFVVHYRNRPSEPVYYIPGKAVRNFVDKNPNAQYLPMLFVLEHGIPVPQFPGKSDKRMLDRLDIWAFLEALSKT